MELTKHSAISERKTVTLVLHKKKAVEQPDSFRVCPLGIQLYSPKKFPEFEILEFKIRVPGVHGGKIQTISCLGAVVRCAKDGDPSLYRVWIKFLDLPEAKMTRLECLTKTAKLKCPYCENF